MHHAKFNVESLLSFMLLSNIPLVLHSKSKFSQWKDKNRAVRLALFFVNRSINAFVECC